MGLRIRTNIASINAQRQLGLSTAATGENMAKLSSGYRINKAADDAAGLAVSETMRAKVQSFKQAQRNAMDGISLVQTAEGSMNEVSNILIRLRELATQSASDTIGNLERSYTNKEYVQLVSEIDRIAKTTSFNGTPLLGGTEGVSDPTMFTIHVGAGDGSIENSDTIQIGVEALQLSPEKLGLNVESEIGPLGPDEEFLRETAAAKLSILDQALQYVAGSRSYLGAQQSRLNSTINNLGVQIENLQSANSRIKDVDFAQETASFAQNKILQQSGAAVLAQANSMPEIALALIRG